MTRAAAIVALVMFLGSAWLWAGEKSGPEIERLRQSLQKEPFLSLSFQEIVSSDIFESVDTISGRLWAGRDGRFRLETSGQMIVSNGNKIWNYSRENRQVLVDSWERSEEYDPLTLLYNPEKFYHCSATKPQTGFIIYQFTARDTMIEPQSFSLKVSDRDFLPLELSYEDGSGAQIRIIFKDFQRQARLRDSLFEFQPPSGVEVILMP